VSNFTESVVEDAALDWLRSLGYAVLHGPDIAAGEPTAERSDPNYRDVVFEGRLRQALVRLNPDLPPEALEDAYRKLTRTDAPSLLERNRAVHRMLVDGVTVEYRRKDGSIAGAQAKVIDFDKPENNDWLAVNQFTVCEGQHNRRPAFYGESRNYQEFLGSSNCLLNDYERCGKVLTDIDIRLQFATCLQPPTGTRF